MERIVYRVQNRFKEGPYRALKTPFITVQDELRGGGTRDPKRPGPPLDGIPGSARAGVFGFKSVEQAKEWFSGYYQNWLAEHDYLLAKYRVPEDSVWDGGHQVAFVLEAAKLIAARKIKKDKFPFESN